MVALAVVRASIEGFKPKSHGFVGVFVGATSGIGEATVTAFAKFAEQARIYIVGRSEKAANTIIDECQKLSPSSKFIFLQQDVALIKDVDKVCAVLKEAEKKIDLLYMTQGYMTSRPRNETSEGIDKLLSLRYYSRMRFALNLMPQLVAAPSPRVVSVFSPGPAEGELLLDDLGLKHRYGVVLSMSHASLMNTFFLEELAVRYPTVGFVHAYPGVVMTPEYRNAEFPLPLKLFVRAVVVPVAGLFALGYREVGERMLFHCRSAAYPARQQQQQQQAAGDATLLALPKGVEVLAGSDGQVGSGAYCLTWAGDRVDNDKKLTALRGQNVRTLIYEHTLAVFDEAIKSP